ncbi:RND family transporter, partial [Candidatus Dependentiae bacterium]|nr:RND family transporter [Candidatus Dependentiae bacterium]
MQKFSWVIIKLRVLIIIFVILITGLLIFSLKGLKINPDIISYLPKTDNDVKLFDYIGEEYKGNSLAMVAIESDDIFDLETIKSINILTNKFKVLPGVSYVTSLTNVLDIKKLEDGFEIGKLIDEFNLPKNPEDIKNLKQYTLSKDMYRGRIVSENSTATLIVCRLNDNVDKVDTARKIKQLVQEEGLKQKVYYGGIPFQMIDINKIITSDLILLVPLIILLIIVSLLFAFRSFRGVVLPILTVVIANIWTLGIMSALGIPLTVISNLIPIILIAVGSAYSIHVIHLFKEKVKDENNKINQSIEALSNIAIPVLLTGVTTMGGFLAFVFGSYLTMIREFGIFSCLGVFFSLFLSITFIPALLTFFPVRKKQIKEKENASFFINMMDLIGSFILKRERLIIFIGLILVIIGIIGIPSVKRRVDMLDYFKPGSSIRLTEELLEKKFGGSIPIQVIVEGDILDPEVLNEMKGMEDFLTTLDDVHNPQSIVELIEEMNDMMGEGKKIPDSRMKVDNLWFLIEGEDILEQLVNDDKSEALIQATITNVDTERMKYLVGQIDEYVKSHNSSVVTFSQTGMPLIYQNLDNSIMKSQLQSLIIAICLIFICLLLMNKSIKRALVGLIPIGFTLVIILGFMGFTKIPLDIATVLVGSISIGIGIDYSIHFMNRFKEERKRYPNELHALDKTLETTGKAIIINVITVTLGFLILLFANLIPLRRFGILIAITMISSGIGAITLLPAAILIITKNGT